MSREITKDGKEEIAYMVAELYSKNTRLKELNREMVELIDDIHSYLYVKRNIIPEGKGRELIIAMENVLTKAEGEGE